MSAAALNVSSHLASLASRLSPHPAATLPTWAQLRELPYPAKPDGILLPASWYESFLHPATPLTFVAVYCVGVSYANVVQDGKNRLKGRFSTAAVVSHSAALAVYSLWTFCHMFSAVVRHFTDGYRRGALEGLKLQFCDAQNTLWADKLARFGFLFYLSKFYEVVDTMIILGKGKKSSALQEYHHAGAILTMWAGYRYQASAIWLFCVFNSFIHTLMYTYYCFSALRLPYPRALKRSLTTMQISQFVVGGSLAACYLFLHLRPSRLPFEPELYEFSPLHWLDSLSGKTTCLGTVGMRFAVLLNVVYLMPLTWLFARFFIASYMKPSKASKKTA